MINNLYLVKNNVKTAVCIEGESKDLVIEDLTDAMSDRRPARCFNKGWGNLQSPLLVVNMSNIDWIECVNTPTDSAYQDPTSEISIIREEEKNPTTAWSEAK